ncbi:MAG: hypothetical protein GY943_07260, partial [Chloroflexi bacterium]|nr:hypothetical protein [Chloroflexota bacterium]
EKTVFFTVEGDNGSYAAAAITDFNGRAFLGVVPLPVGTYEVTASFGSVVTVDGESLDLTDDRYHAAIDVGTLIIEDPTPIIYISPSTHSTVDGLTFRNEDILAFDTDTETWSKFFDGADVGLFTANVSSFAILDDETLLMSIDKTLYLANIGWVSSNDIIRFMPTELGESTQGSFEMYLDGSDVGLNSSAETIDAIGLTPDGRLFISTHRSFDTGALTGYGEDLIVLNDNDDSWEL